MEAAIEIKDLWKGFGKNIVLRGVNLKVERGEKIAILGPNGAGKTTLLRIISGQLKPTKGEIKVFGSVPWKMVEVRREIGLVSHSSYLYKDLTAMENLKFYAKLYGVETEIKDVLEVVGLYSHRNKRVSTFSRGMEQRLSIARMLLASPEILLLDELTAGLDFEGKDSVLGYITENFSDKTIMMVGHDFEELERICDKGILLDGKIKAIGSLSEIKGIYGVSD